MLALKLAFRNLFGSGLRTWLNVGILSFAFVLIVFFNGMLDGWNNQAVNDLQAWQIGYGQLWHKNYQPHDPFCLQDAHGKISNDLDMSVVNNQIVPILITQAAIFPHNRLVNILLKGIGKDQKISKLPTSKLNEKKGKEIPAIIGKRMASTMQLKVGDKLLLRWRDKNGTFDAKEIKIVEIFSSNVPTMDNNTVWIDLADLQEMTGFINEATLFIVDKTYFPPKNDNWVFKSQKSLLNEMDKVIKSKKVSSSIMYGLLLVIALLAIFDTQILSIFRRQKEIGTYIALGMTRRQVVVLFTIEGSAHSILAIILGAIYGIPILWYLQHAGIPMPQSTDSYGLSIADKIIPVYSIGMIISSILLVVGSAIIVSFFPTRRISKMNTTNALKGKLQ